MSPFLYARRTQGLAAPRFPQFSSKVAAPSRDKQVAYVSRLKEPVLSHLIARCLCDVPRQEPGATLRGMSS